MGCFARFPIYPIRPIRPIFPIFPILPILPIVSIVFFSLPHLALIFSAEAVSNANRNLAIG